MAKANQRDYYEILSVSRTASVEEITAESGARAIARVCRHRNIFLNDLPLVEVEIEMFLAFLHYDLVQIIEHGL